MRLTNIGRALKITCFVIGLILAGMVLCISWVNAGFRQTMKEALNNSSTAIYIDKINYGKIKIMEEEVAIYNEEQQDVPMIQYTIYKIKKDKYVLMSYLSFLHDLMALKTDMLAAIKDMSERRGEEIYEFTFAYATEEQKDLYEMVINQFEGARDAYNMQEVKQEGEEATIVTISFENPFMGTYPNVPMFFALQFIKISVKIPIKLYKEEGTKMLNIVFMGTPDFAEESLKKLIEAEYHVLAVVTNPDKPQGRGMKLVASPVKEYAVEKEIPIYQPERVRNNPEFIEEMKKLNPDVICVVAYGKILPQELLDIPKLGCINVHGSLLPQYRGAAPIQWAVLNGDKTTGVTTMYMDAGMDTGDMILKEEVTIGENETTGELWDRLSKIGGEILVKTLELIEEGKAPREKQGEDFSVAPMLKKEMAQIDWKNQSAKQIYNLVRGLNPIMGAFTFLEGKKLKFWKVKALTNEEFLQAYEEMKEYEYKLIDIMEGTVLLAEEKKGFYIKAKEGIIQVLEIQGENAKRMQVSDFLRGTKIFAGTVLKNIY